MGHTTCEYGRVQIDRIKAYILIHGLDCKVMSITSGWSTKAGLYGKDSAAIAESLGSGATVERGEGTRRRPFVVSFR